MSWPADEDLGIRVRVYLGADPTGDPSTWPAPVEFTSADRVMRQPIQIRRGRNRNQQTISSGSCTFWLENTDGALTPLLATSVYYPDWDLGVPADVAVTNVGPNPPHVRFAGFVADVQARMVPGVAGINVSAVQVTLGGVWRRITQGAVEKSPLFRSIMAATGADQPTAYWALESSSLLADIGGTTLLQTGQVQFQSQGDAPGSAPLPDFTGGGTLSGPLPAGTSTTSWRLELIARFGTGSDTISDVEFTVPIRLTSPSGTVNLWELLISTGTAIFQWSDTSGAFTGLLDSGIAVDDGEWHHFRLNAAQSGSDIAVSIFVDGVSGGSSTITGKTLNSTSSFITINETAEADAFAGSVGHVTYWAPWAGTLLDTASAAAGYLGEQAHTRASRVCGEEGVPYSGSALRSNECGPQPVADLAGVLVDLEQVDHGMVIEDFAWGFNYRASSQRENLDASFTVDLSTYRTTSGTQEDVLTPIRNDQRTRNEWTIDRPGGASGTARDETHQAKRGRYDDSATVNVEDDTRILDEAQWRVHEGTFDGLRYQTVPLDIAANVD